jgi:predicted ArsR family transcriptional regulator
MASTDKPEDPEVAAVVLLGEPTRRRLYGHVVRQADPVGRDEAAAALDLARSTVAFHLDRLAEEGLLEVVYERRTGRSGPGAGRPAKLYRRSSREVAVSLPSRHYDLAGDLLAGALEEAEATGASPRKVLQKRAHQVGRCLAAAVRDAGAHPDARRLVLEALESCGYEPRTEKDAVVLVNCPFHALAEQHTGLVCGMNLHLLDGVVAELAEAGLQARLDPEPNRCCVVLDTGTGGAAPDRARQR